MKNTLIYIVLIIFALSAGCNKPDDFGCFKSTGKIEKEERHAGTIKSILLQDGINIVFIADSIPHLILEGGKNLLPGINTSISGDSLTIEDKNYCNWVRKADNKITLYIYGQKEIRLYHKGFGKIEGSFSGKSLFIKSWSNESMSIDVKSDYFWLESFKMGNTTLTGKIKDAEIFRHETGIVRMNRGMTCENLIYHDHGQGKSYLKADHSADIVLYDSGNAALLSKPSILKVSEKKSGHLTLE